MNENDEQELTTRDPIHPRRGRARRVVTAITVAILLYGLSPYFSFWRFTEALKSGDKESLIERVDFLAIRVSLKKQLNARFASSQPAGKRAAFSVFSPSIIDALVDAFVTPEGLAALIAKPKSIEDLTAPAIDQRMPNGFDWSKVKYGFFTGVRDFAIDLEGTRLRFRFTGFGWRLRKIDLPLDRVKI